MLMASTSRVNALNEIKESLEYSANLYFGIFLSANLYFPSTISPQHSLERKPHLGEENCLFYRYVIDFASWEFNSSYHTRIDCDSTMSIITVEVKLLLTTSILI